MKRTSYSCWVLMKIEFSWLIFEKYSDIKFNENPSSQSGVYSCGQPDGQAGKEA